MENPIKKREEVPSVPLPQNETLRAHREKTGKQNGSYDLYQEFWQERRTAEGKWAGNEKYDPYWLEINPDDLTNDDFFYYMMLRSGKVNGEEAKKMLQEEYWPRVEKHLKAETVAAEKRAKSKDEQFNLQKFHDGNSRYNFYHWLWKMAEQKVASAVAGKS